MPTLDDVYRKFGEVSEAAQLLETELGNVVFIFGAMDEGLFATKDSERAAELLEHVDASTLGTLICRLRKKTNVPDDLELLLTEALKERNRLSHSFYRKHNFRRNSENGRAIMLEDLEAMHECLLKAYKKLLLMSGTDIDALDLPAPTRHLPL